MNRILYLLSAFFLLLVFENCKAVKSSEVEEPQYLLKNSIVDYGYELFKREGCQGCHTLQLDQANARMISLDGLGGKYMSIWLHDFLDDPNMLIPGSTMPRYTHLYERSVDKQLLQQIVNDRAPNQDIHPDAIWEAYIQEAELIADEIRLKGVRVKAYNEVIPLIAYLQSIPASPAKLKADSDLHAAIEKRNEAWNNLSLDSDGVILKTAGNPASIARGKIIFQYNCTPCHGDEAGGMIGPNLTDDYWLHGNQPADIARTIIYGVPQRGMISWKSQLTPIEVGELVAFITSIRGSNPPFAKDPQGERY